MVRFVLTMAVGVAVGVVAAVVALAWGLDDSCLEAYKHD